MEEKERYEIHIYGDYRIDLYDNSVFDKSITNEWELEELLNQQDNHIKELEEENRQLKEQLLKKEETYKQIMSGEYIPANIAEKFFKLSEQTQKQLVINEFEKLKDFFLEEPYLHRDEEMGTEFLITKDTSSIADYVLDRIKKLKGEK